MELGDVVPDVFVAAVAEELAPRPIGAQDRAVRPHPVQRHGAVLERVVELVLPPAGRFQGGTQRRELFGSRAVVG